MAARFSCFVAIVRRCKIQPVGPRLFVGKFKSRRRAMNTPSGSSGVPSEDAWPESKTESLELAPESQWVRGWSDAVQAQWHTDAAVLIGFEWVVRHCVVACFAPKYLIPAPPDSGILYK
ncbi:hypothetical protein MAPG_11223 [Magnaporthiopsis poae ATCC 64411]|uniref:Uncharacterized protein n=1 Tax=Magnaporthiopsis poae (strain ATCC 64411 / 73-15) TaxID=644358 RepID=A0A0C4EEP9_MAGP6|nr:hypothetical protein MAPG_11223 [Magnaporthiopsis poae ATCC 64411]